MAGSLAATFGTLAGYAVAFLLPRSLQPARRRIFLGFASGIAPGQSSVYTLPSGDRIVVANTASPGSDAGPQFKAYSDNCPHLGCRVHYEAETSRYFCPCHQGVFDTDGVAVSGPPAQAGQSLRAYPVEAVGSSLYVVVEDS